MLANLPKWTGDASNLTGLARQRSSSAETALWERDPAAQAEVAYLDGGATESEPEGITQPGDRLRVYNLAGYGEPLLLSEVLISSKSLSAEAAALAFMRRGPYDVRPPLLLLMLGQHSREVPACIRYGTNYLHAWCLRRGMTASHQAIEAAAFDGLGLLYRIRGPRAAAAGKTSPLAVPAAARRAKSLAMRHADYRRLRSVVLSAFQSRYLEAVAAFASVTTNDERLMSRDRTSHLKSPGRSWRPGGRRRKDATAVVAG